MPPTPSRPRWPSSTSAVRCCTSSDACSRPCGRPTRLVTLAKTSSVPGTTLTLSSMPAQAPTSVARRRLCWIPWRGVVVSLVCARLSRPLPACTPVRRSLTTSSPSRRCRRSCATARNGSSPWAPRSPMVSPSTLCLGTWLTLGSMRPRWALRCVSSSTSPVACDRDMN